LVLFLWVALYPPLLGILKGFKKLSHAIVFGWLKLKLFGEFELLGGMEVMGVFCDFNDFRNFCKKVSGFAFWFFAV